MDHLEEATTFCEATEDIDTPVEVCNTPPDTTTITRKRTKAPRSDESINISEENRDEEYKRDEFIMGLFKDYAYPGQVVAFMEMAVTV